MPNEASTAKDVTAAEARAQLEKIIQSDAFAKSPALASFLSFVVTHHFDRPEQKLKAYMIATEALGRGPDFDPETDPIVRIQAGRLRKALESYYADAGRHDTVRIDVPAGGYSPRFSRLPAGGLRTAAGMPGWRVPALLAVAMVGAGLTGWWLADNRTGEDGRNAALPVPSASPLPTIAVDVKSPKGSAPKFDGDAFGAALEAALARFDETVVLIREAGDAPPAAKYRVLAYPEGGNGGPASVRIEVVRAPTGKVVFVRDYALTAPPSRGSGAETAVELAASDIAQPFGAVLAAEHEDPAKTDDIDCILRAFDYSRRPGKAELQYAKVCLRWMITSRPDSHIAYALLSSLMLEPYRDGYKPRSPVVYAETLKLARTAVRLAPQSARAHHALMKALFVSGFPNEALAEGRLAVSLNPNDTEVASEYGCKLIFRDRIAEGLEILDAIEPRMSLSPVQHRFCRFLAAHLTDDEAGARKAAAALEGESGMLALIAAALQHSSGGDREGARQAIDRIIAFSPGFAAEPKATLLRRGWSDSIATRVYEDLLAAGLDQKLPTSTLPGGE
jgi:hypothetical protein